MRYIVLDTNCLLQSLPSRSPYHKDIMAGEISLCVNTDILDEYEEKLAEYSCAEVAHNVVEAIAALPTTTMQTHTYILSCSQAMQTTINSLIVLLLPMLSS